MSHEGRMARGKINSTNPKLANNEDTKYYLANCEKVKEVVKEKPKKDKEKK